MSSNKNYLFKERSIEEIDQILDIKFGERYFIKCPECGKTIEYNKNCECGYSTFKEQIQNINRKVK